MLPRDGPCPRVKKPYTYLMMWFALYCTVIIQPKEELEGVCFAHLSRFEGSQWLRIYVAGCENWYVIMTHKASTDASPPFPVLDMVKNSTMWETEDLHLDRAYLSGWSVSYPT